MRLGALVLQEQPWHEARRTWELVESLGFDAGYAADHLTHDSLSGRWWADCWTTLAAAAAVTERMRLGTLVASSAVRSATVVARCAATLHEAVGNWLSLLDARFESPPTALFLAPHDVQWMDILVGRPNGAHFVTLRASEKLIPLTTDIAYTLDEEFVRNVSAWLQQARSANA